MQTGIFNQTINHQSLKCLVSLSNHERQRRIKFTIMKKIRPYLIMILMLTTALPVQAQKDSIAVKLERLRTQKERIISEEKEALKQEVEKINIRLENQEIDWEEAEKLKGEAAKKHALNIENRVAIIDNQIALLQREQSEESWDWSGGKEENDPEDEWWDRKSHYNRTSTFLVVAAGLNNALAEGQSPNDSEFEIGGSRFFEIGLAWRTRVFDNSNWLRLKYGFSFQFNGLKPTDNRYFVDNDGLTVLREYPLDLEKSKFRMDNLVFPLHLEFGPSRKIESERSVWFSTQQQFKIGLGGYAGFSIGERQKLKYEENGDNVKKKLKGDYNTNDFIYGLSGYIGWGATSLYAKVDLNTIFEDPNPELHNVSIGLRFDLN